MDFPEIVTRHDVVEQIIQDDVLQLTNRLLEHQGAQPAGDLLIVDGRPLRIAITRNRGERDLYIFAHFLDPAADGGHAAERTMSINEFGAINRIMCRVPSSLAYVLDSLEQQVAELLRAAYTALEHAYISTYLEWRFSLLDKIYNMTNAHLSVNNRQSLIGRYWFSITNLKTNQFRYQFGETTIRAGATWLKSLPGAKISAYQALSVLIVEDAFDAVFGADQLPVPPPVQFDHRTVILRLNQLPHMFTGQVDFGMAEHHIYNEAEMACIDVVTNNDVSLQLNCPASEFLEVREVLDTIVVDIVRLFEGDYRRYQRDLRKMSGHLDGLRAAGGGWLREFSADVTAKVIAELLGP